MNFLCENSECGLKFSWNPETQYARYKIGNTTHIIYVPKNNRGLPKYCPSCQSRYVRYPVLAILET